MNRLLAVWMLVAAVGVACSVPYDAAAPRQYAATDESGSALKNSASRGTDDVTNGLVVREGEPIHRWLDDRNQGTATLAEGKVGAAPAMPETGEAGAPVSQDAARMLVYRGQIELETARAEEAAQQFLQQVVAWGGYLQQQERRNDRDVMILTVRVPAPQFDAAFALLRASGRVLAEWRQAEDVTEEFVDLGIRLDNAIKSRDRLLEVLAKATKVEDVLAVEKELRRLTEEIERMEGRRKFLADRVAMATIEASFRSNQTAPPPTKTRRPSRFPWVNQLGPRAVMEGY